MQNTVEPTVGGTKLSRYRRCFWNKVSKSGRLARVVAEKALAFYYAAQRDMCPKWARIVMVSKLAYFVSPVDLIPDFIPIIGLADDFVIFLIAALVIAAHIKEDDERRAREQLERIFGRFGDI